jgi:hypothetical protein
MVVKGEPGVIVDGDVQKLGADALGTSCASRLSNGANLRMSTTPDSLYPVLADLPACPLEQRRDPTTAIAIILAGRRYDGLSKRIFVVALCRPIVLRAAWLFHYPHACRAWLTAQRRRSRLKCFRGDVLQHQLLQAQLRYQPLQLRFLLLQILQPSSRSTTFNPPYSLRQR